MANICQAFRSLPSSAVRQVHKIGHTLRCPSGQKVRLHSTRMRKLRPDEDYVCDRRRRCQAENASEGRHGYS
jgi:hypothetical protein